MVSTAFTLVLVPALFSLTMDLKSHIAGWIARLLRFRSVAELPAAGTPPRQVTPVPEQLPR